MKYDDLDDDQNVSLFFREVVARKDALDEEDSGGLPATDVQLADGTLVTWGTLRRASLEDQFLAD